MRGRRGRGAACALLAVFALASVPARALEESTRPAARANDLGAISLKITAATPVLTSPDQEMQVTVIARNTSDHEIKGDVVIRVADETFGSRDELSDWTGRPLDTLETDTFEAKALGAQLIGAGETKEFSLAATPVMMNLGRLGEEPGWGPRGVAVEWQSAAIGAIAQDRTYVVYAPPEATAGAVRIAVTAGLTAGSGESGDAAVERSLRVAAATTDPWIGWALDPALLQAAENRDQASRDTLVAHVGNALEQGKAVSLLPYQDVDVALLAGEGAAATEALAAANALGAVAAREALGDLATARLRTDLAWVARPVAAAAAKALGDAGGALILAPPDQLASSSNRAVHRLASGRAIAVGDARLTAVLTASSDPLDRNWMLADSAFAALRSQLDQTPWDLLVVLPRDWNPADGGVPLLRELVAAPWVKSTALAALVNDADDAPVELSAGRGWPGPKHADLSALLDRVGHDLAFASLTEAPEAYLARALPPLLRPLAGAVAEGTARERAATTALNQAATELPPVQVVTGSDVNLISDDGMVPVVVENQSNVTVRGLVVRLTAQAHAIRVEAPAELDLKPGQSVTARVGVHALANGVFDVRVDLLDQLGRPVTSAYYMTLRVRAEWENVGTAVVGCLLGLVLVLGVISTGRKRRAAKRRSEGAGSSDADDGDAWGDRGDRRDRGDRGDAEDGRLVDGGHGIVGGQDGRLVDGGHGIVGGEDRRGGT